MTTVRDVLTDATPLSLREAAWCKSDKHAEFVATVLRSANDDGVLMATAGNLAVISMMIGISMAGWARRKHFGYHTPILPLIITPEGRAVVERLP